MQPSVEGSLQQRCMQTPLKGPMVGVCMGVAQKSLLKGNACKCLLKGTCTGDTGNPL